MPVGSQLDAYKQGYERRVQMKKWITCVGVIMMLRHDLGFAGQTVGSRGGSTQHLQEISCTPSETKMPYSKVTVLLSSDQSAADVVLHQIGEMVTIQGIPVTSSFESGCPGHPDACGSEIFEKFEINNSYLTITIRFVTSSQTGRGELLLLGSNETNWMRCER